MPSQSRHISSVDVCFLCLVMERSTERRPPRVALAVVPSDPISRTSRCVFQSFRNCITRIAFGLGNPPPRYHDLRYVKNLRLSIAPEFGFIVCKRVQELIEGVVHSGSRLCVAVCTASIDRSGPNEDRKALLPWIQIVLVSLSPALAWFLAMAKNQILFILGFCLSLAMFSCLLFDVLYYFVSGDWFCRFWNLWDVSLHVATSAFVTTFLVSLAFRQRDWRWERS